MKGDLSDFVWRLKKVLPAGWYGDTTPNLDAVLSGFGVAWSAIYALIETVRRQARLATSDGSFIDSFAAGFLDNLVTRRALEADDAFRKRVSLELLRPRSTRQALVASLIELTGGAVRVFEPARPADTGGYNRGGIGYGAAGGWGNLSLPFQSLITVARPPGEGIAYLAGYNTGGYLAYGSLSAVETQVSDAEIYATAAAALPAAYTAWVQITPAG